MNALTIRLPAPHPTQHRILSNARRFNVVCMGEKGGKTTLGIEALVASARGALSGNAPVAWFSATKEAARLVKRQVMRVLDPFVRRRVSQHQVELVNGNSVYFYSLDEKIGALAQFGLIVVDDVCAVEDFLLLWEDLLIESLRTHKGQAWLLSNAYGQRNDFYRLFCMADGDSEWASWQCNSYVNPHLPPEAAAEAESISEPEWRQRFGAEFLEVAIHLDAAHRIIGHDESFLQWCERLEKDGLKVDEVPFRLSDRKAMRFIYELIPSTREEAYLRSAVIMKCTQVGFTVMEMLAMIYMAIKFAPAKIGMFMPSQMLAGGKSSERFLPIVKTIPAAHQLMVERQASGSKGGEGNVLIRRMGASRFHFLWTSGKTSTESFPMDVISFDEVQEMAIADMEKTRERLSASSIRYTLMGSTANWPDADIHWWYKRGTQHQFHTRCPHCETLQVLDEHFPQCIGFDEAAPRHLQPVGTPENAPMLFGEYRYRCHACAGWIDDAQDGEWLALVPEAPFVSVHFPQFLSPTISPREIIEAYRTADDMKNFYNRKLGKPYMDPSQVPVNLEMLNECARLGAAMGLRWCASATETFMGLDQGGNYVVAIIKRRLPNGMQAVVHLEYIFNNDPFARASQLMDLYGVQCAVVEALPNYNDAQRFAQRHEGRVFLAGYGNMDGQQIIWGDAGKLSASERKTTEDGRTRYTVRIDQYKCMQTAMSRFQEHKCLFPDSSALVQPYLVEGALQPVTVCKDVAFLHFTRTALIAEKDEEEKKYTRRVVKVGIDPHTSYANMLCDVAWSRAFGTSTIILQDGGGDAVAAPDSVLGVLPAHASAVVAQIEQEARANTCGSCVNRDPATNRCREVMATVAPKDPGCWGYIAKQT